MGMFDHFPYTNFHELNLNWILEMLKEIDTTMDQFVAINALKYADPIQWNITKQYEKNTIVIDEQTGTAYISVHAVPSGVSIANTDYWSIVFDLGRFIILASQNFANSYESTHTTTATIATNQGKWIVWNSILYEALNDIHVGDSYVIDGNIKETTVETFVTRIKAAVTQEISDRIAADTALQGNIDAEATIRGGADTALQGNIDAEALARSNADTALQGNIDAEALARSNADTTLQDNIDAEALARSNADTALQAAIDAIHPIDYKTISNSSGALSYLMQVAKSYIDHNDDLAYGNYNTLFSTNCIQIDGKWVIDCSSFVEACLKGITYENSRYNGHTANIIDLGYDFQNEIVSDPDKIPYRPYGMVSSAMYHYCELKGYNYEIDNIDRIQIGDLVFLANNSQQYKSIGHVGFVINIRKAQNAIVLLDASDDRSPVIQTSIISLEPGTTALYGARFPLPDIAYLNNNLLNNGRNNKTSQAYNWPSGSVGATENLPLITNNSLKAKTVYSFIMLLSDPFPDNLELGIMALVNGSFSYLPGARFDTLAGGYVLRGSFYTPPLFASSFSNNVYSIRLRALRTDPATATRTETINIKWYGLFEGLCNEPIENLLSPAADDIITKSTPFETETVVANISDLESLIASYGTVGIDWTKQTHIVRVSANITLADNTLVKSGRYLIEGISYANGAYGGFIMRCVSGAHIIVDCAITNSVVSFSGITFNS